MKADAMTNDEPITTQHWLPETADDWMLYDVELRQNLQDCLFCEIDTAVEMDPENPDPVKILSAWWLHTDAHGVLDKDTFIEDLKNAITELAFTIIAESTRFKPVRIYKDVESAYGVAPFDFRGPEYPFDMRALVQFDNWQLTTDKGEKIISPGFRFTIATTVLPEPGDEDVYVGKDWAKVIDAHYGL